MSEKASLPSSVLMPSRSSRVVLEEAQGGRSRVRRRMLSRYSSCTKVTSASSGDEPAAVAAMTAQSIMAAPARSSPAAQAETSVRQRFSRARHLAAESVSWSKPRRCSTPCSIRMRTSSSVAWPNSRAWARARSREMARSPEMRSPRAGGGKREHVGGVVLAAEIAIQAAQFGIAGDAGNRTARPLATSSLQAAGEAFARLAAAEVGWRAAEGDATAVG